MRRWVHALWPLAMLIVFAAAFRRTAGEPAAGARVDDGCESPAGIERLERCLAIDPGKVELMEDLGAAYASSNRIEQAEAVYRHAVSIDPHAANLHIRLGEILLARGDTTAARAEGEAALRWRPGSQAAARLVSGSIEEPAR